MNIKIDRKSGMTLDEYATFFEVVTSDQKLIKTKSGYKNNRCAEYDDVPTVDPTAKFQEFGDRSGGFNADGTRTTSQVTPRSATRCNRRSYE